jgi:hypothetical protein
VYRAAAPLVQRKQGWVEFFSGRVEASLPYYRAWYANDHDNPFARWCYAMIIATAGDTAECERVLQELIADFPSNLLSHHARMFQRALAGDGEGARAMLTPEFEAAARTSDFLPLHVAVACLLSGDIDRTLQWLEIGMARGLATHDHLERGDKRFAALIPDPRFQTLLSRMRERSAAIRP